MALIKHLNYFDNEKTLLSESCFRNETGKLHGKSKHFTIDGILKDSFTYNNGVMTERKEYYKKGQIKTHWVYKDSEVVTTTCYFEDGDVACKYLHEEEGLIKYKYYHDDGKLLDTINQIRLKVYIFIKILIYLKLNTLMKMANY